MGRSFAALYWAVFHLVALLDIKNAAVSLARNDSVENMCEVSIRVLCRKREGWLRHASRKLRQ